MIGYISAFQSLGTVDGPGVRAVVFSSGCPLKCGYCHNPETRYEKGKETDVDTLFEKIKRLKPYLKNGGVTFSGGEPLMQAKFFSVLAEKLKGENLSIALDTSGCFEDEYTDKLLSFTDIILLDVKFTSEEEYQKFTGGSLKRVIAFLEKVNLLKKRIIIRQVIVEGLNDNKENAQRLKEILSPFNIEKIEFLPFKKLCLEKYQALNLTFPFEKYPQTSQETIDKMYEYLK